MPRPRKPAKPRKKKVPIRKFKALTRNRRVFKLFEDNRGLAFKLARQFWENNKSVFRSQGVELPDLQQEALILLGRAAEDFDPSLGFKFSTLAWEYIVRKLTSLLRRAGKRRRRARIVSLDQPVKGEHSGEPLSARIRDKRELETPSTGLRNKLLEVINGLRESDRNKRILIERFGLSGESGGPKTLEEIGRKYGVSKERIRVIGKRLLKKLREHPEIRNLYDLFRSK